MAAKGRKLVLDWNADPGVTLDSFGIRHKKETYSMNVRRWAASFLVVCAAVWAPVAAVAQWNPPNPVVSIEKQAERA